MNAWDLERLYIVLLGHNGCVERQYYTRTVRLGWLSLRTASFKDKKEMKKQSWGRISRSVGRDKILEVQRVQIRGSKLELAWGLVF